VRKAALDVIVGFDRRLLMYATEDDMCASVKAAGYRVYYYAGARLVHAVSASVRRSSPFRIRWLFAADLMRYHLKHGDALTRLLAVPTLFGAYLIDAAVIVSRGGTMEVKVLFLTPRLPFPPNRGGEIIIYNVLRQLSARHEIALVTFYDRPDELGHRPSLERYCRRVEMVPRPGKLDARVLLRAIGGSSYSISRHLSPQLRSTLRRVVQEWRPEVAQVETFVMSSYLPELRGTPTVLAHARRGVGECGSAWPAWCRSTCVRS
jgi:hypothetical protein